MTLSDRLWPVARITFLVGSVTFIVIGLAHTTTQLTTLSAAEVQEAYRAGGPITVNGSVVDGWDLFAGVSLLMGFYAIAFGIAGLVALKTTKRSNRLPSPAVCAVYVAMLSGIMAVGATLLGPLQLYGGLAGIVMFGLPLILGLRHEASPDPSRH